MPDLSKPSTYQAIYEEGRSWGCMEGWVSGLNEGREEGMIELFLIVGPRRLGPPDEQTREAIWAIKSEEELERLADRLFEVETWDDLLR